MTEEELTEDIIYSQMYPVTLVKDLIHKAFNEGYEAGKDDYEAGKDDYEAGKDDKWNNIIMIFLLVFLGSGIVGMLGITIICFLR